MSAYTKEEIEALVAAWKEENASTGIKPRDYAREIGINPKNFSSWVERRIEKEASGNRDAECRFTKIGTIHASRFSTSVTIEYCGARMVVGNKESMRMVLSALREMNPT